jgi:uncharacterized membrane protein
MNCPRCQREITQPVERCQYCNLTFGREIYSQLTLYFGLKNEYDYLNAIKSSFEMRLNNLSIRLTKFKEEIGAQLQKLIVMAMAEKVTPPVPVALQEKVAPVVNREVSAPPRTDGVENTGGASWEFNLGQKWLLVVGIVAMVFGIGYFLKYSFDQGWIGPAGRVALAFLWGIAFLVAGNQFRKKQLRVFGFYLIGGGIAVLYFAAFAAFQIYHLFGQVTSFLIMILITALACTLSIIYDTKWLAVLALIGGFLTPVLLNTGVDNPVGLMAYLSILNLGLLGVAFYKRWSLLNWLGFIFTYLLFSVWYGNSYQVSKFWPVIIFLNLFYFIYCLIPFAYQFRRVDGEKPGELGIMTLNALIAFGYGFWMIKEYAGIQWVSLVTVLYAVIFLGMATILYRKNQGREVGFVALISEAMLFLIVTVPLLFSGQMITIFWAAQALALVWVGWKLKKPSPLWGAYALVLITNLRFLFFDYPFVFHFSLGDLCLANYTSQIMTRYLTILVLGGVGYWFAVILKKAGVKLFSPDCKDAVVFFSGWGVLIFLILNIETVSFFSKYLPEARFAAISVLWALFSVAMMIKGLRSNFPGLRKTALWLFLFTIVKVFLFDMAKFSTPYRILSFLILGLILIGTSYLYHQFNAKLNQRPDPEEKEERM